MSKAANKVIAGDYSGKGISISFGTAKIHTVLSGSIPLAKSHVDQYELVTDEHRKSAASGVKRGVVGGLALGLISGPVGLIGAAAGVMSAKNKGIYQVAIQFADGKRSLVEVDDEIYKAIVKKCF